MGAMETLSDVLPSLLRRNPAAVRAGTIVQMLAPDAKQRVFYTWQGGDVVVTEGVSDKVDLTLSFTSAELARFLDDSIGFDPALATKRVKVMGDASLLLALAAALRGAA